MSRKGTDVRRKPSPPPPKPFVPQWIITMVIVVVMLMWIGSIVYSTSNPDWPVPPSVHAATVAVITGLMGYLAVRGRGNGA